MTERPPQLRSTKTRLLLISLLLASAACSTGSLAWAAEKLPVARIVSVEAPSAVSPSEVITIVVGVEYSSSYSTDVAILDAATGFVLACKGLIIPAGPNSFAFQLTSREQLGIWNLTATVRVWWHEGWYANQNGATFPFEITITNQSQATLAIKSNTVPITITIDNVPHELSSNGLELAASNGFHTIEAQLSLDLADGIRAVFDHWSDGVRSFQREIYVSGRLDLWAIYTNEYLLTVKSKMSETVGSGWYPAGANATYGVVNKIAQGNSSVGGTIYMFTGWSGDSDSSSPVDHIIMNGRKTVHANWSEASSQTTAVPPIMVISIVLLAGSVSLFALGALIRKRRVQGIRIGVVDGKSLVSRLMVALVLLAVVAHSPGISPANASPVTQPETVAIGDATWYHWNQAVSDTLLIWLGGGIVERATYLINPYDFESYNTIYFIQDLSQHYDVLALKKGSLRYVDPVLNRTVFREPYPGPNDYIRQIHSWAYEHGYTYLYIVGYSVGAMAAAKELVVGHPDDWNSPNGLIIITTKISEELSLQASALRASLLLLFGDKVAPEFTTSGETFFSSTIEEGWKDTFWFHKEFHVIPDVEHEVWTIMDTGEYDSRAVLLTTKFIETTKSLQFQRVENDIASIALNPTVYTGPDTHTPVVIEAVDSPSKAMTDEAFTISTKIHYSLPSNFTIAIVTFDTDSASLISAARRDVNGDGETQLTNIIVSGERPRSAHFALIPLIETDDGWRIAPGDTRNVTVQITDSFSVTLIVGYQGVGVWFDNRTFQTGVGGDVSISAAKGEHLVSVPTIIVFDNRSRAVFQQWSIATSSPSLRLSLSHDLCLLVLYRRQYYLNVTSPLGHASGTGYYDENSLARFRVAPFQAVGNTMHAFVQWTGDSNDVAPESSILMNGSKSIEASWRVMNATEEKTNVAPSLILFAASFAIFFGGIIFVGVMSRERRRYPNSAISKHLT